MDFKNILKLLSLIGMTLSLFFSLDVLVGVIYDEFYHELLLADILFFGINFIFWFFLRKHIIRFTIKESILAVNILWVMLGIAGAIPLYLYTPVSFSSAFFEAVSGFTTTGATIYGELEKLPDMILFHRSLMHWLGGMGIIVLGVGLLSMINPTGSLSLFKAEATGVQLEKLTPKIKDTALSLWGIYVAMTVLDMVLLKIFGMNWFDAINHAFSTISTGGFSTKNASLGYFHQDGIIWVTTVFMLLSGINFLAHIKLFYQDTSGYKSAEVKWYLSIFFILSTALALVHFSIGQDTLYFSIKHAFFTIASVLTTTGFATLDYEKWGAVPIVIIFIAMFSGGNAGSTAGGVKVIRYVIIFKTLFAELKRITHPNALISVFVDNKKMPERILSSTFGFFFLFALTVFATAFYIYARGFDMTTAISGSLAIVGNIGPGLGQVGPSQNFSIFSDIDKWVLSFAMIIGRLEFYTVLVLFSRSFWKRF
jgi:trk system potassium uptake protein TrkH